MMEITLPKITKIKEEPNSATFVIEPLFPGFGVTVGNSLRRVLFSSLPGAAVWSVKLSGVSHEFSTIPGVKEDVINIILNLKSLRLKIHEGDEATLPLEVKGPKEVKASDIKVPASVEIINPDLPIATLAKNGKLSMEIKVNKGLGYEPVERKEEEKLPLGTIAVDSLYTPVKKVNFQIENTRVGRMTNYDKLTLEITTDGTMDPETALKEAAQILVGQFNIVSAGETKEEKKVKKKEKEKAKAPKDVKSFKVEEAGFSSRVQRALLNNKIKTIGGLVRLSEEKLSKMKGLGEKGISEIKKKLEKLGIKK